MTKPVWSNVLAFEGNSYSQFSGSLSIDYKYLHAKEIPY